MNAISSSRPIFLSRTQRRIINFKRFALAASLIAGSLFVGAYFFGG